MRTDKQNVQKQQKVYKKDCCEGTPLRRASQVPGQATWTCENTVACLGFCT